MTVAVVPKGTTHEFWKAVHKGARAAGEEIGVEILWKGPLREDDRNAQIDVIDSLITRGIDALVLAPLDDVALVRPVREATDAGIPVVIFDSDLQAEAGEDYVSFVATDNYKGGQLAAKRMAELLEGEGQIVMLRYQEGSASTQNREQGFMDEIARHEGIEVVSDNQYGGATTETAFAASENLLSPLRQGKSLTIDGIFTPNESTTFGMLRALQDGGDAGEVTFVGFDASAKLIEAMRDGQIHGLVLQNPYKMGYEGVKTVVAAKKGEDVPARIDTGATMVTPDNLDDPDIKPLWDPAGYE